MKLSFVIPRYGIEIMGGAESAARMLAEHTVEVLGWPVDVYTTCALDHISWRNELPAGDSELNGVTVHRFRSEKERTLDYFTLDGKLRVDPDSATLAQSEEWVQLQGPICSEMIDAIEACDSDLVAFYPYLYYPTVEGIKRIKVPSLLHPALYLKVFQETFKRATGLVYHARAERRLTQSVFPVSQKKQIVLGLGTSDPCGAGRPGGEIVGIGDRPYIVALGRVDEMKGATALAAFFEAFKRLNPGPLALVFVGPVLAEVPSHQDIVITGPVSEPDKWDILGSAEILISPSAYESFSLVILEAWRSGIPVMVNGACEVTREHCETSGGGLWFDSFSTFRAALEFLMDNPDIRSEMALRGASYVDKHYRWPTLIKRFGKFAERIAEVRL